MSRSPREVRVQIQRVVIDAAALGTLPRELLRDQISAAIAQRLGGAPTSDRLTPLANRIGEVVAPSVTQSMGGRRG
jgi:hypothetical protein